MRFFCTPQRWSPRIPSGDVHGTLAVLEQVRVQASVVRLEESCITADGNHALF
jgi:hypothetical protein